MAVGKTLWLKFLLLVFIATCMNHEVLLREAGAGQDLLHPTCLDSKIVCELLQFSQNLSRRAKVEDFLALQEPLLIQLLFASYGGRDRQLNWAFGNSISTLITSGCKYSGVSGSIVSFLVKCSDCRSFYTDGRDRSIALGNSVRNSVVEDSEARATVSECAAAASPENASEGFGFNQATNGVARHHSPSYQSVQLQCF